MWKILETKQLDDGTWEVTLGRDFLQDGTPNEIVSATFAEDHEAAGDADAMAAVALGQTSSP